MAIARLSALAATLASAVLMTGCVVAPADGVYYGDAYSTYSSGYGYGYGSGYGYSGYPYYGGSSLVIESSPTYVYGGGRPYYRPGGHYRPNYNHGYNRPNNVGRPGIQGSRPTQISPGSGAALGRPLGNSGGARPAPPPSRLTNDGRGRLFQR